MTQYQQTRTFRLLHCDGCHGDTSHKRVYGESLPARVKSYKCLYCPEVVILFEAAPAAESEQG